MNEEVLKAIKNFFPNESVRFYHADKKYSSTKGNYLAIVGDRQVFIKVAEMVKLRDIVEGHEVMQQFYALPQLISIIRLEKVGIILMEKINGQAYSSFLSTDHINICHEVEKKRLALFISCIASTSRVKNIDIRKLKCSHILWDRLETGARFTDFYENSLRFNDFKYKIVYINGIPYHKNIDQIVTEMRKRMLAKIDLTSLCIFGHCDSHRGNIFIENTTGNPIFIDTEYAEDGVPIEVEICKPYYNDLYGFLFFSEPEKLQQIYGSRSVIFDQDSLFIEDFYEKESDTHTFLKNKAEQLLRTAKQSCIDNGVEFNSRFFKDLLLICHLLTKDPETYTEEAFAVFIKILTDIEEITI